MQNQPNENILRKTEFDCAFSEHTQMYAVFENTTYYLKSCSKKPLTVRWMLNILMNFLFAVDYMKYCAINFFNQKNKYRCKISRAKTWFNFLNPFLQKRSLPILRLLVI